MQKIKAKFKGQLLEKARTLCQDNEVNVRKIMVTEVIEKICRAIDADSLEFDMLEKVSGAEGLMGAKSRIFIR